LLRDDNDDEDDGDGDDGKRAQTTTTVSRSEFLNRIVAGTGATGLAFLSALAPDTAANAFEGGVGGLGKTKPSTGVVLLDAESSPPFQDPKTGYVSAELLLNGKQPVRVSFEAPWPLLPTTAGLEARDLQQPESAFVQVVAGAPSVPSDAKSMRQLMLDSVLSQQGKFGAYAAPTDVKVKKVPSVSSGDGNGNDDLPTYSVTFTTFTPGLRESERQLLVKPATVTSAADAVVLLVVGTTRQRFASRQEAMQRVCDSFEVVATPPKKTGTL